VASIKHLAVGVSINWAYGPGEFRILTSVDGGNFEEAAGWRTSTRAEVSYTEHVMFDAPRNLKTLILVMRSPKAWGFFGINEVSLLVRPGPSMLVSGSADAGELCLVSEYGVVGVDRCLDAIARGSAEDVFSLNDASQLVSASTGECVSSMGKRIFMQDCEEAAEAGDDRSLFSLTPSSHLKTKNGYCLSATTEGATAAPCSAEGENRVAMIAVPEVDLAPAARVKDVAALLLAAAERQRKLLQQLKSGLQACKGLIQGNASDVHVATSTLLQSVVKKTSEPLLQASGKIDAEVGVDLAAVKALILDSKDTLKFAQ